MATQITTKAKFIKMLEKEIKDDEYIVLTSDVKMINLVKKRNAKDVTFTYAADTFAMASGINHFHKNALVTFTAVAGKDLSPELVMEMNAKKT